jgi:hypothetical protein
VEYLRGSVGLSGNITLKLQIFKGRYAIFGGYFLLIGYKEPSNKNSVIPEISGA